MNTELLLAILGIIATIIIGVWGVRISMAQSMKPKLLYFSNTCFSLFNSLVRDLEDIEIKFKNEIIDENLLVLKGTLFNAGNSDIDKSIIYSPLSISLPDGYHWVFAKIINKSGEVEILSEVNGRELLFDWDILKKSEYFTFDSIVEYKPINDTSGMYDEWDVADELQGGIEFSHRIKNLGKIKKEEAPVHMSWFDLLKKNSFWLILFVLFSWSLYENINNSREEFKVEYAVENKGVLDYYLFQSLDENGISFRNENEVKTISIDEFNNSMNGSVKIVKMKNDFSRVVANGVVLFVLLIWILYSLKNDFQDNRLSRRIGEISDRIV